MSGNPVLDHDCGGSYTFFYSKELNFLHLVRNFDEIKQQTVLEVIERLDRTMETWEKELAELTKRRQPAAPAEAPAEGVNEQINPEIRK